MIEGDCINVIWYLQSSDHCLVVAGVYVDLIRSLSSHFVFVSYNYIPRLGNSLALSLSRNISIDVDGESELPPYIQM